MARSAGRRAFGVGVAALLGLVWTAAAVVAGPAERAVSGRWDATVTVNNVEIPFVFEIAGRGQTVTGSFFNGDRRISSAPARVSDGRLRLSFDQYAATLDLTVEDGRLSGEYRRAPKTVYPFTAVPAAAAATAPAGPPIAGVWIVQAKSNKGEKAWRFIARESRGQVSATILRVDGDTGTLTGAFRGDRYVLSHFSGARPLLLEVTPHPDGTLTLRQNGRTELTAVRDSDPRAASIGEPTNPSEHTTVKDAGAPFAFSFPDLSGRVVSNTDAQFEGKVVLVNISGSWCPNCHDEAPFLAALYRKYHDRGLEIVTLSFEDEAQLANPTRLRAFIDSYGLKYTVLLAGEPEQVNDKVPQAVNLNAFPTTFILGRDGRVRGTHAGFPSPGSGEFYKQAEQSVSAEIERLLGERKGAQP
jgi:peroxiredoxin